MSTKKEILDYVMNTPNNTNRAVLESLLDNLEGGGSEEAKTYAIVDATVDSIIAKYGDYIKLYYPNGGHLTNINFYNDDSELLDVNFVYRNNTTNRFVDFNLPRFIDESTGEEKLYNKILIRMVK